MAESGTGEVSFDRLAVLAGVERRTVFRHFPNKETLLEAYWTWLDVRVADRTMPQTPDDFCRLPPEAFAGFDAAEVIIRASLHTKSGRDMRLAQLDRRRAAFHAALAPALQGASPEDAAKAEAIVHALYSAATWETLRDYCGLDGRAAGEVVAWAIGRLLDGLAQNSSPTTIPTSVSKKD